MLNKSKIENIDQLVRNLSKEEDKWMSLAIGLDLADEIMKGILPNKEEWQKQLTRDAQHTGILPKPIPADVFKNKKQRTWFHEHPESASARIALQHFRAEECALESNFYWFSEKETKQKIAASTEFTQNWEDSDLTRKPEYKVGIDFFLTADTNKFIMVLSNRSKLRVLELSEKLSNTQKQIFMENLNGAAAYDGIKDGVRQEFEPQRTIHQTLWNALQLKEVNKKFYAIIAKHFNELVDEMINKNDIDHENSKQFATRLLGRLLFVWFLRKMGIINEEARYFDVENISATDYYQSNIKRLFFGTLNTPVEIRNHMDYITPYLNGGLFEPKENDYTNEILSFPENFFKELYDSFDEFNFTTDESSSDYELIAVDPEMLGQVFESLLSSQINEDGANERNQTGSFYTPREIVDFMCKETLRQYLYEKVDNSQFNKGIDFLLNATDSKFLEKKSSSVVDLWGVNSKDVIRTIKQALDDIKILDPACGSGAYPMGMLQLLLKTYQRIENRFDPYKLKLAILENNIYGVDIQPMAVEISRLRAWLSVIIDEQDKDNIQPLPNLDFKFVSANSLVRLSDENTLWSDPELDTKLETIRRRYFNARKEKTKKRYQEEYYSLTQKVDIFDKEDSRAVQLKTFDPFRNRTSAVFFDSHYMFGIEDGFDVVIGNPPYIHFERMKKEDRTFYSKLGYKTYAARGDIYTLFYEKGISLLKKGGILTYITSNKWMRAGYGKKIRDFFVTKANPLYLVDLGSGVFDSATVDSNILIIQNKENQKELKGITLERKQFDTSLMNEYISENATPQLYSVGENWSILSDIERSIKEKIEAAGVPLKEWDIKINYGIKTGLNEAFIISREKREEILNNCQSEDERKRTEELIRPILRGRDIKKYSVDFDNRYLIATFPSRKYDIDEFPSVKEWLINGEWVQTKTKGNPPTPIGSGKLRLEQSGGKYTFDNVELKTRKKTSNKWFETQDSISYWEDFSKQKVIWPDIATSPRFSLIEGPILINDTCFMITNAPHEIIGILNSKVSAWYLPKIATDIGRGGLRYKKQFVEKLILPDYNQNTNLYKNIEVLLKQNVFQKIDELLYEFYEFTSEEIVLIEFLN